MLWDRRVYSLDEGERIKALDAIKSLIYKRDEILFAYVHGSFLEGRFRDLDLAVYLDRENGISYSLELESAIEETLDYPVDLRVLNNAPLAFKFRVMEKGLLLFSRDDMLLCDFECLTMAEYHDFRHHLDIYRREAVGLEV